MTRDLKKDPPLDTSRRVAELTAELEAANRELEAFSYSVAHDLRAPLRHIDGFARMALEKSRGLDDALVKQLSAVVQAADTMGKMIDGLLTLSRVGRAGLERRPVDMAGLVEKARSQLGPDAARPTLRWEVGALPTASGDPELLQLVWINLLANAFKYSSRHQQPEIQVGAQTADDGKAVFFVESLFALPQISTFFPAVTMCSTASTKIEFRINISTSEIISITLTDYHSQIHKCFHDMITIAISLSKSNLQINKHFHDMIIITVNHSNMFLKHHQHKKHII